MTKQLIYVFYVYHILVDQTHVKIIKKSQGDVGKPIHVYSWIQSFFAQQPWAKTKVTHIFLQPPPHHGKPRRLRLYTIYIYIFSLFNVSSLHSNEKHDFWDTMLYSRSWSVAWMSLSLLWIGSMVVPGTKAENSQPEPNNWELEGIFGRSTTCLILRLKGAELYTRAVRPLRPVPTVTSQIAQLETINKSSQARKHAGSSQLSNVNPGLINPKAV